MSFPTKKSNSPTDYLVLSILDSSIYGLCYSISILNPNISNMDITISKEKLYFIIRNTFTFMYIYSIHVYFHQIYSQKYFKLNEIFYYKDDFSKKLYDKFLFSLITSTFSLLPMRFFYFYKNKHPFIPKDGVKSLFFVLFFGNFFCV